MLPPDCFTTETTLRVRYAEADSMGIVHHSNYTTYLEEGRSDYARQRGYPYGQVEREGIYLLVTEINLRYHKPAHYEDLITVRTCVTRVQSRGMVFSYEILRAGDLLVTGTTKHICITHDGQVARVPEAWRDWARRPQLIAEL